MTDREVPAERGYRWPAEWEPHAATWLAWPHNPETWPGTFARLPHQFADLARTIARFEPVHILAGGSTVMAEARSYVGELANVTLHDIATNDAWCRDHGPQFVVPTKESGLFSGEARRLPTGKLLNRPKKDLPPFAVVDWEYNAWGGKYPPFDKDNAVPRQIARQLGCRRFVPGIVMEGGALEGNGCGTLLTTEQCLLHPNRNPHLSRQQIERYLRDYLGAREIHWLRHGELAGDDTDGHVDQLARFVDPNTIVAASEQKRTDANFTTLQRNLAQLRLLHDQHGARFRVIELPMPAAKFHDGERLPASYCNFYLVNGGLIVPLFEDPADAVALSTLAEVLPQREIVGLPALDVVWGLGAFHCLTQQQPAAPA